MTTIPTLTRRLFLIVLSIIGATAAIAQIPTWEKMPLPHPEYSLVQTSGDGHLYAGNSAGIWVSTDSGSRWTQIETGDGFLGANVMVAGDQILIAAGNYGSDLFLNFSMDGGTTWSLCNDNPNRSVGRFVYNRAKGSFIGIASSAVIRSTDGQNWTTIASGSVTSACEANIDLGSAYYFYTNGDGSIMRSTDGGTTWKSVAPNNGSHNQISVADDGTVYAVTNDFWFSSNVLSTDNGDHWNTYPQPPVGDEAPMTAGNYQYVVRPSGTYRLNAMDTVWRLCVAADSGLLPSELLVLPDGRLLLAAEDGVYRTSDVPVDDPNAAVDPVAPATALTLDQNYPNPFSATTAIHFAIAASGIVTLKVYNAIGQEVRTLVNGYRPAGSYGMTMEAAGLPSGVYTCRLSVNTQSLFKQMMLQ